MAAGSTVYTLSIELSDTDRGVYQSFELRLARHPSETAEFMLTRALAYCLEYEDGIAMSAGIAAADEPAVWVKDLTGRLTAWIEVGAPTAERIHKGSKQAARCAVYTHRDPAPLLEQLSREKIHRAAEIPLYSFGRVFLTDAAASVDRRAKLALSVTGRHLYLDVGERHFDSPIEERRLG
jgi:uncharacterized protein YaeQ